MVDGHIEVPRRPGLGVELNESVALAHPGVHNVAAVTPANLERMRP